MFLVDTNIFLEILLSQNKKEDCKKFLENNIQNLYMTDLSLHSIGIILFKYEKENIFQKFIEDVVFNLQLVSLPKELYKEVIKYKKSLNLDFDDAYQYSVSKYYRLTIVTMDKDFRKVKDVEVLFL